MPAHSSHKLQPLDVSCFTPLKKVYRSLVEQKAHLEINYIDKLDFLKIFPEACGKAFKAETIQNSFAETSLILFNPDRVLS